MDDQAQHKRSQAERDLLFGILTVQLGLATPRQVMLAASEWAIDRSKGLADRLLNSGIIDAARTAMVRSMVDEAVSAHAGDTQRTLDTFGGDRAVSQSFGGSVVLSPDGDIVSTHELKPITSDGAATGEAIDKDALKVTQVSPGRYTLRDRVKGLPTKVTQAAEIGRGGIGRVLVAFDEHLGREVALKELLPIRVGGSLDKVRISPEQSNGKGDGRVKPVMSVERVSAIVARFLREARVTGQLEHPNIVPVYELGRNADDTLYYTMKVVRGRTLAESLEEAKDLNGRLRLLKHFVDLCQAIAYAHSRGVIHRDLKPENVMLGEFGETVVLDWGLAKVRGVQDIRGSEFEREIELLRDVAEGHTVDGTAVGTPAFMSPEQAYGRLEEIDERSDVWSLGAVLYQILTGRPPYEGATAYEVIGKVLKDPVSPVCELCDHAPPELASVSEKALAREKEDRYRGAKELAEEVGAYLTGGRVNAYAYGLGDLLKRLIARYKVAFVTGGISLLLLLGLGIWSYVRVVEDRDRAQALRVAADDSRQEARLRMAEAHSEGGRAALMRKNMLEARAKLRSSLEVADSVAARVLWAKLRQESQVWKRVMGCEIYDVMISPSGRTIAAAGFDGSVYLLDFHTAAVRVLRGHQPWVATLAFSADGKRLATAGSDKSVRIWNVESGKLQHTLDGHTAAIHDLSFSPDGQLLASSAQDKTIRLWQTHSGASLSSLTDLSTHMWCLQFSVDGKRLYAGGREHFFRVYAVDGDSLREEFQVAHPGGSVATLALSADGRSLATGGNGKVIHLWDLKSLSADSKPLTSLTGHTDGIAELAFHPDGTLLASGAYDHTVRLWSIQAGAGQQVGLLREHSAWIAGVDFSPDGQHLVTASEDHAVALWRLPLIRGKADLSHGHIAAIASVIVDRAGRRVASGSDDRSVREWDLASGAELQIHKGHADAIKGLGYAPTGQLLSLAWDKKLLSWPSDGSSGPSSISLAGDADLATPLHFSPDGHLAAGAGYDRSIRIWDLNTGAERVLEGHSDLVRELSFSAKGRLLATASWDKTVKLWDTQTGKMLKTFTGHSAEVANVVLGPKASFAISSSWDHSLRRWDTRTGQGRVIANFEGRYEVMALSPDGRHLACGSEAGRIDLWDLGPLDAAYASVGERQLHGHRDLVAALAFSPDGSKLVSGSDDSTLRLWDVVSGQPLWRAPVMLHPADGPPLAFTHQGWIEPGRGAAQIDLAKQAWRMAAQGARNAALSERVACIQVSDTRFELWDRQADRLMLQKRIGRIDQLLALPESCAVRAAGQVHLFSLKAEPRRLASTATAMGWAAQRLLIAESGRVREFEASGLERASVEADVQVTALTGLRLDSQDWIAIGYQDGTVELSATRRSGRSNPSLEDIPSSPVIHMEPGPKQTLILGFANGLLGIWDMVTGARLDHAKLHGPVAHTAVHAGRLHVVTELGDHLAWDLSVFSTASCDLLEAIWDTVPIVWEHGRPVHGPRPLDHPCLAAGGASD